MKRNALALTLLAAFGLGLVAGPHPCSAQHEAGRGGRAPSCHDTTKPGHAALAQASVSSHGESSCCDTFCLHACHTSAVAEVEPVPFVIAPVAPAVAAAPDPGLALFAHAIDHVPLA
jgi:hypothetical protein